MVSVGRVGGREGGEKVIGTEEWMEEGREKGIRTGRKERERKTNRALERGEMDGGNGGRGRRKRRHCKGGGWTEEKKNRVRE